MFSTFFTFLSLCPFSQLYKLLVLHLGCKLPLFNPHLSSFLDLCCSWRHFLSFALLFVVAPSPHTSSLGCLIATPVPSQSYLTSLSLSSPSYQHLHNTTIKMRVSATTILALPLLATAAESPFEQYKAQFQNFLSSFGASAPSAEKPAAAAAPDAAAPASTTAAKKISVLTTENWKDVLYEPVKAEATTPEEWWVLITGGNKTCFGMLCPLQNVLHFLGY